MDCPDANIVEFLRERGEGRIVDEILRYEATIDGEWGCGCPRERIAMDECPEVNINEVTALRVMADSYTNHPQYNPDWSLDDDRS